MDFGDDEPQAIEHLQRQLETIDVIVELASRVQIPPEEGSSLAVLVERLGDGPIHLGRGIQDYLQTTLQCLRHVRTIFAAEESTSMSVLQSVVRPVLLTSGRVIFILGPEDPDIQLARGQIVLRQELNSYLRALKAFSGFRRLLGLKPPPEVVSEAEDAMSSIRISASRHGEGEVLDEMARHIAREVVRSSQGDIADDAVTHAWHTFSGGAHGYAWPDRVPGDFISTFGVVVPAAHLAMDLAVKRTHR